MGAPAEHGPRDLAAGAIQGLRDLASGAVADRDVPARADAARHVLAARLRSARSEFAQQQARSDKEEFDDKVTAHGDPAKAGEWRERAASYSYRDRAAHRVLAAAAALPSIRPVAASAVARHGLPKRAASARQQRRR
ncbi:hypothetical protein [Krasilnikovia sp. MM14-A1259]|uniref:hypothetical protein n=1 Tax=Krasilnikovia sp. MM14-A1259 TaxID=3373539 RepID=UPI00382765D7